MGTFAVRVTGATKRYPQDGTLTTVVEDISFEVGDREVVALLGPSGCGKSTLLRAIADLEKLDGGAIEYGRAGNGGPPAGIVFQEPLLLPWLTIRENVALGLRYRVNRKAGTSADVDRVLGEFGIAPVANAYPSEVSGGQAQRASLARTVVTRPSVLLLDEPFSALDPATRGAMQGWLREVIRLEQLAAVLVTHDVDEALTVSDRVLLMSKGPGTIAGEWGRPLTPADTIEAREAILGRYHTDVALGATGGYVI
jgi:sulfate transport system ATP-binding protein/sulfonate transport system ATP-binding protein